MKALLVILAMVCASAAALAHEVRPTYLQIRETAPDTYDVLWKAPGCADEFRMGLYVEFPADVVALDPPRGEFRGCSFSARRRCAGRAG